MGLGVEIVPAEQLDSKDVNGKGNMDETQLFKKRNKIIK